MADERRPLLRGYLHLAFALAALPALAVLLLRAESTSAYIGAAVFGGGMMALFGVSATYHLIAWHTRLRWLFQRLDHTVIFLAVACFYTPFCLQVFDARWQTPALAVVWGSAIAGTAAHQLTWRAPPWVGILPYLATGWIGAAMLPGLLPNVGTVTLLALVGAGVAFTAGAVIFAAGRPSPVPGIFGHHELFHLLVGVGCAMLYAVVLVDVLPR